MWGENSQFIRMNNSKVRQTGVIDDMSYSISLISNNRQTSTSQTITGDLITDKKRLTDVLDILRNNIKHIPEDPYIVYPIDGESSNEKHQGNLLSFDNAVNNLLPVMQGVDLTGIWASGSIYTGAANSLGQNHWFETETFSLDYSLITSNQRMVKDCFAGTIWNQDEYENI